MTGTNYGAAKENLTPVSRIPAECSIQLSYDGKTCTKHYIPMLATLFKCGMSLFSDNFRFLYDYTRTQVPEMPVNLGADGRTRTCDELGVGQPILPLIYVRELWCKRRDLNSE